MKKILTLNEAYTNAYQAFDAITTTDIPSKHDWKNLIRHYDAFAIATVNANKPSARNIFAQFRQEYPEKIATMFAYDMVELKSKNNSLGISTPSAM